MSDDAWFSTANPSDLEIIATALEDGRVSLQVGAIAQWQALGLADPIGAQAFVLASGIRDARAAAWGLRQIASERRSAGDRWARVAQLVWSGHEDGRQPLRDTRGALEEIFGRAERHVLVATYAVHDGPRSLGALARRMHEKPRLEVDLYVHMKSDEDGIPDERRIVSEWLGRFVAKQWPVASRLPRIWYDPATLDRTGGTSLHAKCVVVDERWAFITSANFTEAAQERNIEVGVLLDHVHLARMLRAQFEALRDRGIFREALNLT